MEFVTHAKRTESTSLPLTSRMKNGQKIFYRIVTKILHTTSYAFTVMRVSCAICGYVADVEPRERLADFRGALRKMTNLPDLWICDTHK